MTDSEQYKRAKKRVEEKLGFYIHAGVYLAVNLLLIIINLAVSPKTIWFVWPLLGWGIGVVVHYFMVFHSPPTSSLKERMIKQELARQGQKPGSEEI